jgi:hypothetical protein
MPFQRRWSDEQREAVVQAVLVHGLSVKRTAELAAEGRLPGVGRSLEPFPMPWATVADYARADRNRRGDLEQIKRDPSTVMSDNAAELAALVAREVDSIKRSSRRGRVDLARVREAARTGREVFQLQEMAEKAVGKRDPGDGKAKPARAHDAQGGDFLEQLAESTSV